MRLKTLKVESFESAVSQIVLRFVLSDLYIEQSTNVKLLDENIVLYSCLQIDIVKKFWRTSYELPTNFLRTSYELLTNFLRTSYELLTNFL